MYGVLSSQRAARLVSVRRFGPDGGFALDVERVVAVLPDVAVVWLCDPNNPTGAAEPAGAVEAVLEAAAALPSPPLVVVDEAYHEFTGRTYAGLRSRFPNLLVVRTMSKAFALPGIRVGYGVAARETIARLERVRPPGSMSTLSAHLATVALGRPADARANVSRIEAARDTFVAGLMAAGWSVSPSVTNFVLAHVGSHEEAEATADRLLRAGIVPRTFGPANPLRGHLRLTVRTPDENERLLEAIR
jgi:histidinol-phosphate aminotransferase